MYVSAAGGIGPTAAAHPLAIISEGIVPGGPFGRLTLTMQRISCASIGEGLLQRLGGMG